MPVGLSSQDAQRAAGKHGSEAQERVWAGDAEV